MRIPSLVGLVALLALLQACNEPTATRPVVGPGRFKAVAAGGGHACAVDTLSRAWCWGSNGNGAVGVAIQTCTAVTSSNFPGCITPPTILSTSLRFSQISAGRNHTCALTATGEAWCWGSNAAGQLGTTATIGSCDGTPCTPAPVAVAGGLTFKSIAAGYSTTCGVTTTGVGKCWGTMLGPILGAATPISQGTPVTVRIEPSGDSIWSSFARPGQTNACGASGGRIYCWGAGNRGQLGISELSATAQGPVAVSGGSTLSGVVTGNYFSCALDATGKALCWGGADGASAGGGCSIATPVTCSPVPQGVPSSYTFTSLTAGPAHVCGILSDRVETRCWGSDIDYAVGLGVTPFAVSSPYPVFGEHPFAAVTAGEQFACGLTTDSNVWCWGSNRAGQLGVHPLNGRFFALVYSAEPFVVAGTVAAQ